MKKDEIFTKNLAARKLATYPQGWLINNDERREMQVVGLQELRAIRIFLDGKNKSIKD